MANKGSTISVSVSKGANLPDVRGETRDEAVRTLEKAGFKVKEESAESTAGNKGYVTKQDPQGVRKRPPKRGGPSRSWSVRSPQARPPQEAKSSVPEQTPVSEIVNKNVEESQPEATPLPSTPPPPPWTPPPSTSPPPPPPPPPQ
jgi:beta-lactam-binding protein with PASTA domain